MVVLGSIILWVLVFYQYDRIAKAIEKDHRWNRVYREQIGLSVSHLEAVRTANKAVYQ